MEPLTYNNYKDIPLCIFEIDLSLLDLLADMLTMLLLSCYFSMLCPVDFACLGQELLDALYMVEVRTM